MNNPTDNQTPQPVDELDEILDNLKIESKVMSEAGTDPYNPPTLIFVGGKEEAKARLLQWGTRQRLDETQTALNMTKQAYHTKTALVHIDQVSESVFIASNQYLFLRTESLQASLKDGGTK